MKQTQNRTQEVLDQTGLNWTVREEMIHTESGIIIPKSKALVREDTNSVLSISGLGYFPYQNHQMVDLLDKVSRQVGLPIHNGGYFGNGEKVYLQLKSSDFKLGEDKIEGYITGVNSFDGSTSLAFGPSNITISCQNKFFAAFRHMRTKVRHTKNMEMKIEDICRDLEGALEEETKIFGDIKRLSEAPVTKETKDWVTRILFNLKEDADLEDEKTFSTVTRNRLSNFHVDMNGEIKDKGENLWGIFSGVTKFTTHSLGKGDNNENKMFGNYGNRERHIFSELVEMVN